MKVASATDLRSNAKSLISFGIIAWNEEASIGLTLQSLFRQNIFENLAKSGELMEVFVLANDCSDGTVAIARQIFEEQSREHPYRQAFTCRVVEFAERGKDITWNRFVHDVASLSSQYFILCDADVALLAPGTLWNMYAALEHDSKASVAIDTPIKDIALRDQKSLRSWLSLGASRITQIGEAQMTGQLYCIRASIARNIYLPADLGSCDDGFIKNLACTYFLTRPLDSNKVIVARDASHVFEAYVTAKDVLNNQKRQTMGQAVIHFLIDKYLPQLSLDQKLNMAETIRTWETTDPEWLKRLICQYSLQVRWPWQLVPQILTFRFKRLAKLPFMERLRCFPAALIGSAISLVACIRALRAMRKGAINYWPHTQSCKLASVVGPVLSSAAPVPLPQSPVLNSGVKP